MQKETFDICKIHVLEGSLGPLAVQDPSRMTTCQLRPAARGTGLIWKSYITLAAQVSSGNILGEVEPKLSVGHP